MAEADPRTYHRGDVIAFRKTNEVFGGLSNMAPGYPIRIFDVRIATAEALYQACRFPHLPEVQKLIIAQTSPMTAKMLTKPYRKDSRSDWDKVRIPIMKWCLKVKLVQNWSKFGALLLETGERAIVEDSRKDDFWGARPEEESLLRGRNVLGRLLMELRENLKATPETLETVLPVRIPDFMLFSQEIPTVILPLSRAEAPAQEKARDIPTFLELLTPGETDVTCRTPATAEPEVEPALIGVAEAAHVTGGEIPSKKRLYAIWLGAAAILLAGLLWLAVT
ncbi:MAG TPA: NADAR family protein [Allosphingosinicella sp.]|jgi:ribA/ribD-fused uncharacterized protein|nr:NADAR family protein [Allosphingosinicella sp.]